jgi:hypothetical protein
MRSLHTPDTVETRLGTLKFFDGLPDEATVQKMYDNLDFMRGRIQRKGSSFQLKAAAGGLRWWITQAPIPSAGSRIKNAPNV